MKKKIVVCVILVCTAFLLLVFLSNVDNKLYKEDIIAAKAILNATNTKFAIRDTLNYEEEIQYILSIQRSVLQIAPKDKGIPEGEKREPQNLMQYKYGLCYDRSRAIEKILRSSGFKTRHIYLISTEKYNGNSLKACFSSGVESHAISEVLTRKGWLLIDSNKPWIAIDKNMIPYKIEDIKSIYQVGSSPWYSDFEDHVHPIYKKQYSYIYGMYSRHGAFYPPFNFLPDLNWMELYHNF